MALHDEVALDGFTERDPAERSRFNRLFYRNRRPTWFGHWVSQFFCWWARVGLTPHAWVALFRVYSILTILILVVLATLAFSYVPAVAANQPTSWLGLSERIAQYALQLWHAVLATVLLRRGSKACGF